MDEELKELAALALRNAFWNDFSALVNKYLKAAKGLDIDDQEMMMGELTSIYGRNPKATAGTLLSIQTWHSKVPSDAVDHVSLVEALEHEPATEVWLQGRKVFERRDGEWYFTGD